MEDVDGKNLDLRDGKNLDLRVLRPGRRRAGVCEWAVWLTEALFKGPLVIKVR
jgi:hypothetical protein